MRRRGYAAPHGCSGLFGARMNERRRPGGPLATRGDQFRQI